MKHQTIITERAYSRAPSQVPLTFLRDETSYHGSLRNTSLGGVFVETRTVPEPGAVIALRFALPPRFEPISLSGRVVRVETDFSLNNRVGMGVKFRRPSQLSLKIIESYVQRMRRTLRMLKIELESDKRNDKRIWNLAADTGLDLPSNLATLEMTVREALLQFRLRGRTRLRRVSSPLGPHRKEGEPGVRDVT